ncbi:MAG: hypothetical protein H7Z13_10400 [Ferruginibacter sp.]|nr:hypothetical protein [Ferruginibacter sp.]
MEEKLPGKQGIYLVANLKSEALCENLIYSIRKSGCTLPIRVIPFGGEPVQSRYILQQAEMYDLSRFPPEGLDFIKQLRTVLVGCPLGFLHRFLALYGDWEEFIYSDNDIVALMNWEKLFGYLSEYDFVHADEEYTTHGRFNYDEPDSVERIFGPGSLLSAFTAGHFVARRNTYFVNDMIKAIEWFQKNPSIPKKHDQALMHIASLIGKWNILNLCREPHNWLSPWAGDYNNTLAVVQAIQKNGKYYPITHMHYSGFKPTGVRPVEELIFASVGPKSRLRSLIYNGMKELSGYSFMVSFKGRVFRRLKLILSRK